MSRFTIHATRDDPDAVLNHLGSIIAAELESAVRSLPDCDGDVSPGDYTVQNVSLKRSVNQMEIHAEVIADA